MGIRGLAVLSCVVLIGTATASVCWASSPPLTCEVRVEVLEPTGASSFEGKVDTALVAKGSDVGDRNCDWLEGKKLPVSWNAAPDVPLAKGQDLWFEVRVTDGSVDFMAPPSYSWTRIEQPKGASGCSTANLHETATLSALLLAFALMCRRSRFE